MEEFWIFQKMSKKDSEFNGSENVNVLMIQEIYETCQWHFALVWTSRPKSKSIFRLFVLKSKQSIIAYYRGCVKALPILTAQRSIPFSKVILKAPPLKLDTKPALPRSQRDKRASLTKNWYLGLNVSFRSWGNYLCTQEALAVNLVDLSFVC